MNTKIIEELNYPTKEELDITTTSFSSDFKDVKAFTEFILKQSKKKNKFKFKKK